MLQAIPLTRRARTIHAAKPRDKMYEEPLLQLPVN
jgi:hypothetical protein